MTQAVEGVLLCLAILLVIVLFIIVLLIWKNKKQKNFSHQSDYLIVYASQSGHAENLAKQTQQQLQQAGYSTYLLNIQDITVSDLQKSSQSLWIVSTYGEGDLPDTARQFYRKVMQSAVDLSQHHYAILALGDRHYKYFCRFGTVLQDWLQQQQAHALFEMICVNQLQQSDLQQWQIQLQTLLKTQLADLNIERKWSTLKLTSRQLLNQGSQGNPLFKLEFSYTENMSWQAGDLVEIQCHNAIDVQDYPIREYSIASLVEQNRLELVVRQEVHEQGLGLGSGLLTHSLKIGESISACIRQNSAFHLNLDFPAAIFIGNGSGIAGLLAHIRQQALLNRQHNWLIYGERQAQFDTVYGEQIQAWQQQGVLTEVDRVFSRDGQAQKYVQDCLYAKSELLKQWLNDGAAIYVCGSMQGMAQQVDQALLEILGKVEYEKLYEQKRYLRDVY